MNHHSYLRSHKNPPFWLGSSLEDAITSFSNNQVHEIVLTLGAKPQNECDWGFMEREAGQLVVVEGGRQRGQTIELSEMRVVTKVSDAKMLFRQLKKAILSHCTIRGVYTKTGVFYKSIYYSPNVVGLSLKEKLTFERASSHYLVSCPDVREG
ncbi:MAG: hypothetical protein H6510_15440 [Acidobacteria bacterium]|nr:hypothetical protein [Acidobacteriota bacterium]